MKGYLRTLGIDEGETPHSLRAVNGCGNTRDIMDQAGWFSKDSFLRYSRLEKMVDVGCVSNMLKQVASSNKNANAIFEELGDANKLPLAFES